MLSGAPPIAVGDKLYIYYRGTARRHAKIPREFDPPIAADQDVGTIGIGLAMLRLDGFASINASFDGGQLTTRPFALGGDELQVNVKADYGQLTVEMLDEEGNPMPGHTAQDCVAIAEDGVAVPVRWRDGRDLSALRGQPVRLRFALHNARLYAYWCS